MNLLLVTATPGDVPWAYVSVPISIPNGMPQAYGPEICPRCDGRHHEWFVIDLTDFTLYDCSGDPR